jgi:probable HAF family extracellular repeat protein
MLIKKRISVRHVFPFALAAVFGSATAAPAYSVKALGSLGGDSRAFSINDAGQIAGYSGLYAGPRNTIGHAFIYSGGKMKDIGALGGATSSGLGINRDGKLTGTSRDATSADKSYVYGNAVMTSIGSLGGRYSAGTAINVFGQVAGVSDLADGTSQHAYVYGSGGMKDLGTLGGRYSRANSINDAGQVVGYANLAGDASSHAFLYSGGKLQDLGTFGPAYASSQANDINNVGQIVGSATLSADPSVEHAFLYAAGIVTNLGPGRAVAINDAGQILLASGKLYYGGVTKDLNAMIDPASGWSIIEVADINNKGQIVGYGYKQNVGTQAIVLTPACGARGMPACPR